MTDDDRTIRPGRPARPGQDSQLAPPAPWSDADLLLGLSETATSGLANPIASTIRVIGRAPGQVRHFFMEGSDDYLLGRQ